jgi:predicted outer membrane protein
LEAAPRVGRLPDVEREQFQPVRPGSINADEAIRRAVAERLPDRDVSYDLQASTQAQQVLDRAPQQFDKTAAQDDIAYVQQLVDDYRAQGLLSEADENLIAEADEIVNRSGQLGQAAREAATCMTRRA